MGWECPCGTSVGTRAHWCEWRQQQHAERVERLLALVVSNLLAMSGAAIAGPATAELMALTAERREEFEGAGS